MSEHLYDKNGNRLYLNTSEREAFALAADKAERRIKCLCLTLLNTGCRVSEALEITPRRIDLDDYAITLRSLKKRKDPKTGQSRLIFRSVPIPKDLAEALNMVYGIREIQKRGKSEQLDAPLWAMTRVHAWRLVKAVMDTADIVDGAHKTPKGLRHGYGINAMMKGIQLNMLQKWMGHSDMKTTAIYADAIGADERAIAERMWN